MMKIPINEYKKICIEFAKIDDQICRNELEGNYIDREKIVFPSKKESINHRYELFLEMYKEYNKKELEKEKQILLKCLEDSKKYISEKAQNLEIDFR